MKFLASSIGVGRLWNKARWICFGWLGIAGLLCYDLKAQVTLAGGGLREYYSFTVNANDGSANGGNNNGTLFSGASLDTGLIGQAVHFDGVDDYVKLDTNFRVDSNYSFCAWIKPTTSGNSSIFAVRKNCSLGSNGFSRANLALISPGTTNAPSLGNTLPAISVYNQFSLNLERAKWSPCNSWGNAYGYTVSNVSIDTTCWTHVAIVVTNNYSNSTRSITAYINGVSYPMPLFKTPSAR